jgi:hypothetical protein
MNTNQLIIELRRNTGYAGNFYRQIADLIEQQQKEIEALRMMLANRNDALDKLDLK